MSLELMHFYPGDAVVAGVLNVFLQVTAVTFLALLATVLVRRHAASRYALLLCALVMALASPLLAGVAARSGWTFLHVPLVAIHEKPAPPVSGAVLVQTETDLKTGVKSAAPILSSHMEAPGSSRSSEICTGEESPWSVNASWARKLFAAACIVWILGAVLLSIRLLWGWRAQSVLRRELQPLEEAGLEEVLRGVRENLGVNILPRLMTSAKIPTPVLVGIVQPAVVLPEALALSVGFKPLQDILVHECAHVFHGHNVVGLLQRLAEILFWPHPLIHGMNRELFRAREEICDNHVLLRRVAPDYAETLLFVAQSSVYAQPLPTVAGLLNPNWPLSQRVKGLLDDRRSLATGLKKFLAPLPAAGFILLAVAVAGTRLEAQSKLPPSKPALGSEETAAKVNHGDEKAQGLEIRNIQAALGALGPEVKTLEFYPREEIYFRYQVLGLKTDERGNIHNAFSSRLLDAQGQVLQEHADPPQVGLLCLDGSRLMAHSHIMLNGEYSPGRYTLVVRVEDRLTERTAEFSRDFLLKPTRYAIVMPRFFYDEMEKIPAPIGAQAGQMLYFRVKVIGIDTCRGRIDQEIQVQVLDEKGRETMPRPITDTIVSDDPATVAAATYVSFKNSVGLNRPGTFTLRIATQDKMSRQSALFEAPLRVEAPEEKGR